MASRELRIRYILALLLYTSRICRNRSGVTSIELDWDVLNHKIFMVWASEMHLQLAEWLGMDLCLHRKW